MALGPIPELVESKQCIPTVWGNEGSDPECRLWGEAEVFGVQEEAHSWGRGLGVGHVPEVSPLWWRRPWGKEGVGVFVSCPAHASRVHPLHLPLATIPGQGEPRGQNLQARQAHRRSFPAFAAPAWGAGGTGSTWSHVPSPLHRLYWFQLRLLG